MCKGLCVFRKETEMAELTEGSTYDILNITDNKALISNNLCKVEWYPIHYFKFI